MKKGRNTRWRRLRRIALVVLLIAYIPFAATGCGADRLVLGENHETMGPTGARPRTLGVDGRVVEYWVTRSPGARGREPQAIVLYFTGKGSRAEQWIDVVAGSWGERPIEMWGMNYPGSGGSAGPASLARVGPDAVAIYDAAKIEAGGLADLYRGGQLRDGGGAARRGAAAGDGIGAQEPAGAAGADPGELRLVESVAASRSSCVTDPARPRLHCKCKHESCTGDFLVGRKRRNRCAPFSPACGSSIRRRETGNRIARRLSQRSYRRDCTGRLE